MYYPDMLVCKTFGGVVSLFESKPHRCRSICLSFVGWNCLLLSFVGTFYPFFFSSFFQITVSSDQTKYAHVILCKNAVPSVDFLFITTVACFMLYNGNFISSFILVVGAFFRRRIQGVV